MTPETPETPKDFLEYFKTPEGLELDKLINNYVRDNQISPFRDIQMEEDQVKVDLDPTFDVILKAVDFNSQIALEDYFQAILKFQMENLTEEEVKKFQETQEGHE